MVSLAVFLHILMSEGSGWEAKEIANEESLIRYNKAAELTQSTHLFEPTASVN